MNYQSMHSGTHYDYIVCTSGSGGTHAGLLVGMKATNTDTAIVGICVNRDRVSQEVLLLALAQKIANNICANITLSEKDIIAFDEYNGKGYSLPTKEMVETVKLVASKEGILLDPTYTSKAMTGFN